MTLDSTWDHFADLPYEVVTETLDEKGKVTHRELLQRNSLLSEAMRAQVNNQASITACGNNKTHRCVIDRPFANHKEGSE